jgi:hypothetical protein
LLVYLLLLTLHGPSPVGNRVYFSRLAEPRKLHMGFSNQMLAFVETGNLVKQRWHDAC